MKYQNQELARGVVLFWDLVFSDHDVPNPKFGHPKFGPRDPNLGFGIWYCRIAPVTFATPGFFSSKILHTPYLTYGIQKHDLRD